MQVIDPSVFLQFTWPKRAALCIERLPRFRCERDVQTIATLMRSLRIFRRLSEATQRAVAQSVQYMRVAPSRMILRQGHPGYSYYFIFSGAVTVTFSDQAELSLSLGGGSVEGVVLKRGQAFGEVSLLKGVPRTATVISSKTCEFLVLYEDEFHSSGLADYYVQERERVSSFIK